jgi:hypothetical protein
MGPEIRASRPSTTVGCSLPDLAINQEAYADANWTVSMGVKPSPGEPPIVPLIPDIEITRLIFDWICVVKKPDFQNGTKVKIIIPRMFLN